ncbi:hypothetical protein [Cupriavidus sp. YAF13]|uniref:hypothetical protein n=1 Tax=Cupriavidus sp. YAF13 TaxID=3233075 RepID=UPI003F8E80B6
MSFIDHLEAIQCRVRIARDSNNGSNGGSKSDSKMNEVKSKQRPVPQPPPAEAANGARWVKPFALVAATLAVLQFGLLVGRYNSGNAALPAHGGSTPPPRSTAAAAMAAATCTHSFTRKPPRPRSGPGCCAKACKSSTDRTPQTATPCTPAMRSARCRCPAPAIRWLGAIPERV